MTKSEDFDRRFDEGENITGDLVISEARRPNYEQKRVNVDFPLWMVEALDREASRMGVPRQSLIKMLIARHLEEEGEVA
ncbi:MAG: CopG family transcriptional regulator [bacterium]